MDKLVKQSSQSSSLSSKDTSFSIKYMQRKKLSQSVIKPIKQTLIKADKSISTSKKQKRDQPTIPKKLIIPQIAQFKQLFMQRFIKTVNQIKKLQNPKINWSLFNKRKEQYRNQMIKISGNKQQMIKLNISYDKTLQQCFYTKSPPILLAIIKGQTQRVLQLLLINKNLINQKIFDYPPIYYAVRSGHYELLNRILCLGISLCFQKDRSTPLHCASFYGHTKLFPLLFEYGIPSNIKNFANNLPIQEAANEKIKQLIKNNDSNKVNKLIENLLQKKLIYTMLNIKDQDQKIIAKKIILNKYFLRYDDCNNGFHGTKFQYLQSIAQNGLKKPGTKVDNKQIKVKDGNIKLGTKMRGKQNWPDAIFASPSILYASRYAQEIKIQDQNWKVIIQVKVDEEYSSFDHTLPIYTRQNKQMQNLQWRIPDQKSITVVAILLVKCNYLQENKQNYQQITDLILNSSQEQLMKKFKQ